MSKTSVRNTLVGALQTWLDAECDDISETFGVWQDGASAKRNAEIYADAVMACLSSAELQADLQRELGDD